jgi:hypothetical protein
LRVRRWLGLAAAAAAATPLAAFGALSWWVAHPAREDLPLPADAIALDSPEGRALLGDAEGRADHRGLADAFEVQQKRSWCGVASSVAVLNARGAALTQEAFFTPEAAAVRSRFRVTFGGMTLEDLGGLLRAHGAEAAVHHAGDEGIDAFRAEVARNLGAPGDWLVVNYDRRVMDEAGGGHISPLAGWDADTDRVLLLDTASYKYPAHWVSLERLYRAMDTVDPSAEQTRGWVIVR